MLRQLFVRTARMLCLLITPVALAGDIDVKISVTALRGESLPDAYIALLPAEAPWDEPAAETIAPKGEGTLRVKPGVYHALVGAPGHQTESEHLRISQTANDFTFELLPEGTIAGTIQDDRGNPVAARIRQVRAPMSELARGYLGARLATESDANGWWSLPFPSEAFVPLLIEAPGYAPVWHFGKTREDHLALTMTPGAQLRLTLDRVDPQLTVVLERREAAGATDVPSDDQAYVWSRRAGNTTLAWDSLPAGTYRVFVRDTNPLRFTPDTDVATITLQAGSSGEANVILPKTSEPAAAYARLLLGSRRSDLRDLQAFVRTAKGTTAGVRHSAQIAAGGTVVYVDSPAPAETIFLTTIDRLVVARAAEAGAVAATNIHPRATGTLTVAPAAANLSLPSWGMAKFRDCQTPEPFTFDVPVSIAKGAVTVPVPTRCHSLVLQVPPFEPVAVATALQPGQIRELGSYRLEAGGKLQVRVVRDPGGVPAPGSTVRVLLPAGPARTEPAIVEEQAIGDESSITFESLPAGEELQVEARLAGSELFGSATVRIEPGEGAVIDPLVIPGPGRLVVVPRFKPDFLTRFPEARLDTVMMTPADAAERHASRRATPDDENRFMFNDVKPGRWALMAIVKVAGTAQPVTLEDVEIRAGEERTVQAQVEPLIFNGRVTLLGQGAAVSLGISDEPGVKTIRRRFQSDADGRFTAVLPAAGSFDVEVKTGQAETISLGNIDFLDPAVPVDIALPAGMVEVRVTSGDKPAGDATITARLRRNISTGGVSHIVRNAKTNPAGSARIESLPEGVWTITARSADGRVAEKAVTLASDDVASVDLALNKSSDIEGFVRDSAGRPAAGASVDCFYLGAAGLAELVRAETNRDGRFELHLTSPAATLQCGVTTAAGAVGAYIARSGQSASFTLPASTGGLLLSDWGRKLTRDVYWLVAPDGRVASLSRVAGRIGKIAAPLSIAQLASGTWKVVRADTLDASSRIARGLAESLPAVATVRIEPGATKEIRLHANTANQVSP
jgi:hypothetical protein